MSLTWMNYKEMIISVHLMNVYCEPKCLLYMPVNKNDTTLPQENSAKSPRNYNVVS